MNGVDSAVAHLGDVERTLNYETTAGITEFEESSPMIPATSGQFKSLFEYLESYQTDCNGSKPVLLHIGCGDGRIGVTATRFNLCSQTIGIDASPIRVLT
ncbi:hypothetical protein ACHAXN_012826, partial [Cyclotella atomus]